MKTTKRILAVVLAVMMVVAMVPMMAISASAETTGTISNGSEFRTALANGGTYELTKDITVTSTDGYNMVKADTTIIGNGHKISKSFLGAQVFVTVDKNVTFNAENVVFDGGSKVLLAVTAKQVSPNGCTINLTNCTVQNFYGSASRPFPAVYYFGDSKGTLKNCTFQGNKSWGTATSGADVWAGAAADVTIDGGTITEAYGNANSSTAANFTVKGNATVDKLNLGAYEGTAATATIDDTAAVAVYKNGEVDTTQSKNVITTQEELATAAKNGGSYVLGADIDITTNINVASDLVINGGGHTLKSAMTAGTMLYLANKDATLTATNAIFDGNSSDVAAIAAYTGNSGQNPNNVITLNNCTVKNVVSKDYVGAINQFGTSTGNYYNCTFTNNKCLGKANDTSGADIWAGAAATVNINGGTYDEVYLNAGASGGAKANVSGADIKLFNLGFGSPSVNIENGATIGTLSKWDTNIGSTHYEGTYTVDETSTVDLPFTYVSDEAELKAMAEKGGNIRLANDIKLTKRVNVPSDLVIYGNDYALKADMATGIMLYLSNENATLTANDLTIDGNNSDVTAIFAYAGNGGKNPNNLIALTDCTVKNVASSDYVGAINQFGSAKGVYTNCTFTNNVCNYDGQYAYANGADVWAGAATNVTINGGTLNEVYGNADNGGAANFTVENATVGVMNLGSVPKNTATANIADTATVGKVSIMGKEAILTEDNQIINTGGQSLIPGVDDAFGKSNPFTKSFELMGVQTKAEVDNSLRFVSVISSDILEVADDYGYIVGTTAKTKDVAMANAGNVTVDNASKYKVSCVGTSNTISGDYGKYDTDTSYKYVTAAVENITDSSKTIFARVYVTIGGQTYYGDYINGSTYAGCATSLADLG